MGIVNSSNQKDDCDNTCKCNDACYLRKEQENLIIFAFSVSLVGYFLYFFIGSAMHTHSFIQKLAFWGIEFSLVALVGYIGYKYYTNYQILKK